MVVMPIVEAGQAERVTPQPATMEGRPSMDVAEADPAEVSSMPAVEIPREEPVAAGDHIRRAEVRPEVRPVRITERPGPLSVKAEAVEGEMRMDPVAPAVTAVLAAEAEAEVPQSTEASAVPAVTAAVEFV